MRPRPWAVALAVLLAGSAAAQQRTNRDQSGYTELREGGFPLRSRPRIVAAAQARLADADLVIGVVIGGYPRAYPVNLMWEPQNETLNDELGGVAIAATWCPVAHSAAVFERKVGKRTVELGTLGLEKGVFQLYDAQTRSQWSQVSGAASRGPLGGHVLPKHDTTLTTWGAWRSLHPQTTVFYDPALPDRHVFNEAAIARITLAADGPLRNEDLVAGVGGPERSRAWLLRRLGAGNVLNDNFAGTPVAVFLAEDAVTVRVLSRVVDGRPLTLQAAGHDRLRDSETGTTWQGLTGRGLDGPLAGRNLPPIVVTTALWYAWKSQHPQTTLWDGEPAAR